MLGNLNGWHLVIVLVVILLIFGATRLPALARSIGQSTKILKDELRSDEPAKGETSTTTTPESSTARTEAAAPAKSDHTP